MRITRFDVAALGRQREQPKREEGEILAIFVAGRLMNPLNGTPWVWQKRMRYARAWKERVAWAILVSYFPGDAPDVAEVEMPRPKRVSFLASTHNRMDSDGLQASLKPIRDALIECRVITGDADKDGNIFEYAQKIDRKRRGVEIRVRDLHAAD